MSPSRFQDLFLYRKVREHSLFYFVIEVLTIVAGLTVSFLIDEWRHERKQREREIQILYSISEDLKADHKFAVRRIERNEESILISKKLLDPDSIGKVQEDKLQNWIRGLHNFSVFLGNDYTYKTISAEARTLISNASLRKRLQMYYSVDYGLAYDWEDYERKLSSKRREYMLTQITSSGLKTIEREKRKKKQESIVLVYDRSSITKALSDPFFQSLLRVSISAKQKTINFAKMRIASIEEIQRKLDITFEKSSEIYNSLSEGDSRLKASKTETKRLKKTGKKDKEDTKTTNTKNIGAKKIDKKNKDNAKTTSLETERIILSL